MGLVVWLLIVAGVQVAALVAVWRFFVRSEHGQLLDTLALSANSVGHDSTARLVDLILNAVSALSLAVAAVIVAFIALIRRRVAVAFGALLLLVGANVSAQLLKMVLARPDLGVDPERAAAGNSLPSGHTTIAASVAAALILVLPNRLRGIAAVLGAAGTAAVGIATLSAGWHRPSDSVAAALIVGVWACAAALFILIAQREHGGVDYGPSSRFAMFWLAVAALILLAGAALAASLSEPVLSTPADELSTHRLVLAYLGGAAGITGAVCLVLAGVLASAHRVVPEVVKPRSLRYHRDKAVQRSM